MTKHLTFGLTFGLVFAALVFIVQILLAPGVLSPAPVKTDPKKVLSESSSPKQILGFYPYWNLSKLDELDFSALTGIYYFAVDLSPDGSFNTADPGWSRLHSGAFTKLQEKAKKNNVRLGVTIINLDQDSIAKNVNNSDRRQTIINNTVNLMKQYGFVDLNIDLEYVGLNDLGLTKNFSDFVADLSESVHNTILGSTVSLDTFADSIVKPRIFDTASLAQSLDYIIIMGYDFHRINSFRAGPVAPLFGRENYEYDIYTSVTDYLKTVPKEKVILGVPFYGYEWPVEAPEKASFVISSYHGPEISSYRRSLETAKANNAAINFDDTSKSVWFSYYDAPYKTWRQVWFENERSLGLKFDLVNQANLSGIAIFALGYDGASAAPLWTTVREKLKQ